MNPDETSRDVFNNRHYVLGHARHAEESRINLNKLNDIIGANTRAQTLALTSVLALRRGVIARFAKQLTARTMKR
jgi:hypothetical protein